MGSGKGLSLPKVQLYTVITWIWLFSSLGMMGKGIHYGTVSTHGRTLECDAEACDFKITDNDFNLFEHIKFSRHQLKDTQIARIKKGKVVDVKTLKRKEQRNLAFSYSITFAREGSEEDEEWALSAHSLGRKRPNAMVRKIRKYIENETDSLSISEDTGFDSRSIIFMILGLFALLLCLIAGQFSDPPPKRSTTARARPSSKKRSY